MRLLIFANLDFYGLQRGVVVPIQGYFNIETFSAFVRKSLRVKRFLLKKQNESITSYFDMTFFT